MRGRRRLTWLEAAGREALSVLCPSRVRWGLRSQRRARRGLEGDGKRAETFFDKRGVEKWRQQCRPTALRLQKWQESLSARVSKRFGYRAWFVAYQATMPTSITEIPDHHRTLETVFGVPSAELNSLFSCSFSAERESNSVL